MARKIRTSEIYRTNIGVFANDGSDNGFLYKKRKYDEAGNLLWEVEYQRNGREEVITDYYYNDENKVTEKKMFYPQDETLERTTYQYNTNGDVIEESLLYDDELFVKQTTTYNDKNKPVAVESYDDSETLTGRETFEYNSDDLVVKHTHYNETDETDWMIETFYNDKKQGIKEIHHNYELEVKETIHFHFNEAGKNNRSESYDADGNLAGYVEVTFDEENRPVKYVSETMGHSLTKVINQIVYNEEGKILENEYYDVLNGILTNRETYEYDEKSNLKTEELFDLRNQNDKKIHYKLLYNYEFYL